MQLNFDKGLIRRLDFRLLYETIQPSPRTEDRKMMAFFIENRVPMLDYRLAEYCFSLPNKYKIRQGLGKWLLREAMKGILPEKVRQRKDKTGFNAPMAEWIRGNLRSELQDMIHRKCFVNQEIYDQKEVQKLFNEHCHGANHAMFFWQYINLNLWHSIFFKG